ncbi:hypothetical protein K440DRAFT_636568 [Wilcoxina mikolae CBS 423.85]|nr:hypothetical protein K440DRAFT_636568 [Wilcoxina mikolae CBS 423.85]
MDSPRPFPPPHEDSGISVSSPPPTPTARKSPSLSSSTLDPPTFTGDLSADSPRILGGGPTYLVPPERRKEMIDSLNASWTTTKNSMIPQEANCFPPGPTAGPYRMNPRSEKKVEEEVVVVKKEGTLKRWLSRSSSKSVLVEKRMKGKEVQKRVVVARTKTSVDRNTETVVTEAEVTDEKNVESKETEFKHGLPTPVGGDSEENKEMVDPGLEDRIEEIKPFDAEGEKA